MLLVVGVLPRGVSLSKGVRSEKVKINSGDHGLAGGAGLLLGLLGQGLF